MKPLLLQGVRPKYCTKGQCWSVIKIFREQEQVRLFSYFCTDLMMSIPTIEHTSKQVMSIFILYLHFFIFFQFEVLHVCSIILYWLQCSLAHIHRFMRILSSIASNLTTESNIQRLQHNNLVKIWRENFKGVHKCFKSLQFVKTWNQNSNPNKIGHGNH